MGMGWRSEVGPRLTRPKRGGGHSSGFPIKDVGNDREGHEAGLAVGGRAASYAAKERRWAFFWILILFALVKKILRFAQNDNGRSA